MNAHDFHQSRQYAATPFGRIAYVERGAGPTALFLHGFPLNGFQWRGVLDDLAGVRRCIAVDLMGLGYSEIAAGQDLSFEAQARMVASFLDAIGVDQVDLTGNDSGGGVSQVFAARYPSRVRTLTLTNCEVHDLWPNPTLQGLFDTLRNPAAIAGFKAMLHDLAMARRSFSTAYENPEAIPDEAFRTYLEPALATDAGAAKLVAFVAAEESDRAQIISIAPQLKNLKVPAQVIWGDADVFFELTSVDWLRKNIPGLKSVIVPRARLFFPEEHPKLVSVLLREFWRSVS